MAMMAVRSGSCSTVAPLDLVEGELEEDGVAEFPVPEGVALVEEVDTGNCVSVTQDGKELGKAIETITTCRILKLSGDGKVCGRTVARQAGGQGILKYCIGAEAGDVVAIERGRGQRQRELNRSEKPYSDTQKAAMLVLTQAWPHESSC